MAEQYRKSQAGRGGWYRASWDERRNRRLSRGNWWITVGNTLDFASAMLPGLLAERMDAMGIDFSVLYPTRCLGANSIQEPELRQAMCRAYNKMAAEVFEPYKRRMTPAAMIPCYSPEEAIAELEYATQTLGLKACSFKGSLQRPIPAHAKDGYSTNGVPYYIDALGLDNPSSYDPLWQRCIDLHVAVTVHQGSNGWTPRMAISNGEFNRLGHAADSHAPMAKAMFLGGVVRRFPDLTVSFLEGGVAFGVELLCNIIGGWEKRRYSAMEKNLKPTNIDETQLLELIEKYGYPALQVKLATTMQALQLKDLAERETECLDDYGEIGASTKREVAEAFSKNFYFGCEADDPGNAWAFDPRMPARLKAMLGSDIGHWDVTNYMDVLPEVWEGVEDGLLTEQDLEDLCFTNPMELHTRMNPDFFKGTAVEDAVAKAQPRLAAAR